MSPPASRHRATTPAPRATYRLQLHHRFPFSHATAIFRYLTQLGISDVYTSPIFTARPQSPHGYDVCDFDRFNPDLGGASGFHVFLRSLRQNKLGLLLDFVPNHMGVGDLRNRAWTDVLRHGSSSPFARWFDIDWQSPHPCLEGKILLPVLGDHFGRVLDRGELRVVARHGGLWIAYYDQRHPIAPESLETLPPRLRPSGRNSRSLALLARRLNGRPGVPSSFATLADLLDRQHYRLAFWKVGLEQLNYRRFFDITHLAGLRMEDPAVFEATHHRIQSLIQRRQIRGLRIDHPDGLRDPLAYLRRVDALFHSCHPTHAHTPAPAYVVVEKILADGEELPLDWPVAGTTGYEILNQLNSLFVDPRNESRFDKLHRDFTHCHLRFDEERYRNKLRVLHSSLAPELDSLARQLNSLMAADRHGRDYTPTQIRAALSRIIASLPVYRTYLDETRGRLSLAEQRHWVVAIDGARRHSPDLPEPLFDLLGVWLISGGTADLPEERRRAILRWVVRVQQLTGPAMAKGLEDTTFYTWTRFVSLNEVGGNPARFGLDLAEFHATMQLRARRWPDALTATTTHDAKRGEDTRARLNVLSEMPRDWSRAVRRWQTWNRRQKSTVDGAPAPDSNLEYLLYQTLVGTWPLEHTTSPPREYVDRIQDYLLKAAREAKQQTHWTSPNHPFETALHSFIESLLDRRKSRRFLLDLHRLASRIALPGFCNSLSQTLLKLTVPGVPDIYQGTEFYDFSLVDPDNRRPVDYARRQTTLANLENAWVKAGPDRTSFTRKLARNIADPQTKLFVLWRSLHARAQMPELFRRGTYEPLQTRGPLARNICAFRRTWQHHEILVVVPRFVLELTGGRRLPTGSETWLDTSLHWSTNSVAGRYQHLFTGEFLDATRSKPQPGAASRSAPATRGSKPSIPISCRLPLAAILNHFPIALLQAVE